MRAWGWGWTGVSGIVVVAVVEVPSSCVVAYSVSVTAVEVKGQNL